jgi:hypothetical protein
MNTRNTWLHGTVAALISLSITSSATAVESPRGIKLDRDDIGGVVTSANGREAGVWVIAETDAFNTRFARIVVTDEQGRYVVPDLPGATYSVWARGYGLLDSNRISAKPGSTVNIETETAPDAAAAAQVYPAAYWYAMMKLPQESEVAHLPGGRNEYLMWVKNMACVGCHQMGNQATRTFPPSLGKFNSSHEAWVRRIASGQAGAQMTRTAMSTLRGVPIRYFADWTDRIAAGELPATKPQRPTGVERNVVATVRDWSSPQWYLHDLSGTDRRKPTVNAYGALYGAPELSTDEFPILDPVRNVATTFTAPVRDANTPTTHDDPVAAPSPYWGDERIWNSKANAHNPMLDHEGRVWYTARIRAPENPAFCRKVPGIHPRRRSRPSGPRGTWPYTNPERRNTPLSIPASAHITCSSRRMPTTRCGRAVVGRSSAGWIPGNSTRQATPRRRRAGRRWFSTRMATASAMTGWNRTLRWIRNSTSGSPAASTR